MTKILIVDDVEGWRLYHKTKVEEIIINSDITIACSASEAYTKILENVKNPYDIVITDLQMETDYEPDYAGEWLIKQIQMLSAYYKTKIVIISAANNIKHIAETFGVDYIRKPMAINSPQLYNEIFG